MFPKTIRRENQVFTNRQSPFPHIKSQYIYIYISTLKTYPQLNPNSLSNANRFLVSQHKNQYFQSQTQNILPTKGKKLSKLISVLFTQKLIRYGKAVNHSPKHIAQTISSNHQ